MTTNYNSMIVLAHSNCLNPVHNLETVLAIV